MTRRSAVLMLLCAALFWGSGNVASKTVLDHIGPFSALGYRCALAILVIAPFLRFDRLVQGEPGWLRSAIGVSGLFATAMLFQQIAFRFTSVTNVSFLVNTASVMTPVLAWVAFRQRPSRRVALAGCITLGGAFLMSGGAVSLARFNPGDLACLASALFYAGWMVALGRHAMTHGRAVATTIVQFAVTAVVAGTLAVAVEAPTLTAAVSAWREVVFLAVFSTAGAFVLLTLAQAHLPASVAAVLASAESVFGAAGGYLLLNEVTSPGGAAGAALILMSIAIVAFDSSPGPVLDRPDPPVAVLRSRSGSSLLGPVDPHETRVVL